MRIYWHQGGLRIDPENQSETALLEKMVNCVKFEPPAESAYTIPAGSCSSSDVGLESFVTGDQRSPSGFAGQHSHEQTVIPINKAF